MFVLHDSGSQIYVLRDLHQIHAYIYWTTADETISDPSFAIASSLPQHFTQGTCTPALPLLEALV
jgi:hypothetical protein